MNLNYIEHIGIAVNDLRVAIQRYETVLGVKCYEVEKVKDQKVKTAFFKVWPNQNRTLGKHFSGQPNRQISS